MTLESLPFSPAAERNSGPVLEALRGLLPGRARVLEIASGSGQHAARFAGAEAGWQWQPSDADARAVPAIDARCARLGNVAPALALDVLAPRWPVPGQCFDAVYCANMLHIAPWACCAALMRGTAECLLPGAILVLYGPFVVDGEATAASNLAFDADLRARDLRWGLRRMLDVTASAESFDLAFEQRIAMPANNLILVFRRARFSRSD